MKNNEKRYSVLIFCISRKNSNGLGLQGSTAHGKTKRQLITVAFRARKAKVWDSNITLLIARRMDSLLRFHFAQENNGLRLQHNTAYSQMNSKSLAGCISRNEPNVFQAATAVTYVIPQVSQGVCEFGGVSPLFLIRCWWVWDLKALLW